MDSDKSFVKFNSGKVFSFPTNFGLPEGQIKVIVLANSATIMPVDKILICLPAVDFHPADVDISILLEKTKDELLTILSRSCRDICSYNIFELKDDGKYSLVEDSHFTSPYLPSDAIIFFQYKNIVAVLNMPIDCHKRDAVESPSPFREIDIPMGPGNPTFYLVIARQHLALPPADIFKFVKLEHFDFELPCYRVVDVRRTSLGT
jgi:hypothetical protein